MAPYNHEADVQTDPPVEGVARTEKVPFTTSVPCAAGDNVYALTLASACRAKFGPGKLTRPAAHWIYVKDGS